MTALNYVRLLLGWLPSSLSGLTTAPGAATWPAGALSIGTVKIRPLCNGLELGSGFTFDLAPIAPGAAHTRATPHATTQTAATNSPILTRITAHRPQLISATSTTTHHTNSGLIQAIHTHHLIVTPPRLILLLTTALRPRANHASSTTRRTRSTTPGDTATRTRTATARASLT